MNSDSRGGSRRRSSGRAWERRLFELPSHITERDRMICRLLYDHRVLTTSQIADVGFDSLRIAQQRLSLLYDLHVVDRFQPRRFSGSAPLHYSLGKAGAFVIAAEMGVELSDLHWRPEDHTVLSTSRHLDHLVGCNGLFTGLLRAARSSSGLLLDNWWSAGAAQRRGALSSDPTGMPSGTTMADGCPFPRVRQRHRNPRTPRSQACRLRQAGSGGWAPDVGALSLPVRGSRGPRSPGTRPSRGTGRHGRPVRR
jgi:hypothetical protein